MPDMFARRQHRLDALDAALIDKEILKKRLPKVGTVLKKIPHVYAHHYESRVKLKPRKCVVIWVNPDTLCYLVEFTFKQGKVREYYRIV